MKKLLLLSLSSMFLLQSCYSYRTANKQDLEINKTYKVSLKEETLKVKIQKTTDSTIVVLHKKQEKSIALNEIYIIKKRKFSTLKTIGLTVLVFLGIVVVDYVVDPEIQTGSYSSPN